MHRCRADENSQFSLSAQRIAASFAGGCPMPGVWQVTWPAIEAATGDREVPSLLIQGCGRTHGAV